MEEKSTCGSDVLVECRVEQLFFLHGEKIGEAQRTNEDIRWKSGKITNSMKISHTHTHMEGRVFMYQLEVDDVVFLI